MKRPPTAAIATACAAPRSRKASRRSRKSGHQSFDFILRGYEKIADLILRSARLRASRWMAVSRCVAPSFETLAEFSIGPRFARTRWQTPQDEVRIPGGLLADKSG